MCAKKFKSEAKNCNEQAGAELGQAQPKARSKFEVKPEVKKFENEEINSETDNIITGKKENFNSEKVCLNNVKVKTEEIIILE